MRSDTAALISRPSLNTSEVLDSRVSAVWARCPPGGGSATTDAVWFGSALPMGRWNFPPLQNGERSGGGLKQRKGPGGWPTGNPTRKHTHTRVTGHRQGNPAGSVRTSLVLTMSRNWYWSFSSLVSSSFSLRRLTATAPSLSSVPK